MYPSGVISGQCDVFCHDNLKVVFTRYKNRKVRKCTIRGTSEESDLPAQSSLMVALWRPEVSLGASRTLY